MIDQPSLNVFKYTFLLLTSRQTELHQSQLFETNKKHQQVIPKPAHSKKVAQFSPKFNNLSP